MPDASLGHAAAPHAPAARIADLILVGGGLANGLIAWRLKMLRPDCRLLVLEAGAALGGNHTWSFHDGDLEPAQHAWLEPLVAHRWPAYSVAFPERHRRLDSGYASVTSERFHAVLIAALRDSVRTHTAVAEVHARHVVLADGSSLHAGAVIDGRGVRPSAHLALGFQKFLGQEVRLQRPHGLDAPVLMDATVAQRDGYRFVYLLPFSADTLLIEDTFYADGAAVDQQQLRTHIADYCAARGWQIAEVIREEWGVLPITLAGDMDAFWREAAGVPCSGLAAGLFHPTTGYSLPDAVRLADLICALPDLAAEPLFAAIRQHARARWRDQWFFRLLNRMLFKAALPDRRWRVMQRFYGLSSPLIERFYAARLRRRDQARILIGKPPVPLAAALRAALSTTPEALAPRTP